MSNAEVVLTKEGLAKLEAELDDLKNVKRREIAERIKIALSYGDLKENSEYHSAKNDQSFMETRILQIERTLRRATIVDEGSVDKSVVGIGCYVQLLDIEFGEKIEYQIVGTSEADIDANKISNDSPLGKELIGKSIGSKITVDAPIGSIEYELLAIK